MMRISERTAQNWRNERITPFTRLGKAVYYDLLEITFLLEQNTVGATLNKHGERP